jgi:sec-independent protein translocase protein TatB
MLEVGWSELLVIAIVLIVVVGPKDLPKMLRTFATMMRKARGMAADFQGQFNEAMREAELDEVRKTLDDVKGLNPRNVIRDALDPLRQAGEDVRRELNKAETDIMAKAVALETPAAPQTIAPKPAATPATDVAVAPAVAAVTLPAQAMALPEAVPNEIMPKAVAAQAQAKNASPASAHARLDKKAAALSAKMQEAEAEAAAKKSVAAKPKSEKPVKRKKAEA